MINTNSNSILPTISETSSEEGACKANGGENCIFPFTYDGISYKECTWTDSYWYNNDAWCAIEADETTHEVRKFDNCGPYCPVAPSKLLLQSQHNKIFLTYAILYCSHVTGYQHLNQEYLNPGGLCQNILQLLTRHEDKWKGIRLPIAPFKSCLNIYRA